MAILPAFLVYDFESSSADPYTCGPLEIAANIIDFKKLELLDSFHSYIRPMKVERRQKVTPVMGTDKEGNECIVDYKVTYQKRLKNYTDEEILDVNGFIKPDALRKNGIRREDILGFPLEKVVWSNFIDFCTKHKDGRSAFDQVIPVGWNIDNFDNIIFKRLCEAHKCRNPLHARHSVDLMKICFYTMHGLTGDSEITSYSFDNFRRYLGIAAEDEVGAAHTSKKDTADLTDLFIRKTQWVRKAAKTANFKGSFLSKENDDAVR